MIVILIALVIESALFNFVANFSVSAAENSANDNQVASTDSANEETLMETPFELLPVGSVKAKGWLLHQLELQKEGLTGHMEEISPDLTSDSGWLGGNGEDWERGPYYVKGLVALAYTLDDETLKEKAQKWIDWSINSQKANGNFGPESNNDWWPRMPILNAMQDYYDATHDERVIPFMTNYFRYQLNTLPSRPLSSWAAARGGDNIYSVYWLYKHTGDAWLLDLAKQLHDQSEDWTGAFTNNNFFDSHVVNIAQGMKLPALYYQQSGDPKDLLALEKGKEHLLREHGRIDGMYNADEALRDISSTHGVELDGIAEFMFSNEIALSILGNASIGDDLEKVAFNALPATFNANITGYSYFEVQNSILNSVGVHGFSNDHGDSSVFGAPSGFECCFMNLHMAWPKFVKNMWMATKEKGLAIAAYGPSEVTTDVAGGQQVTVTENTNYPFEDQIHFTVHTDENVSFPFQLRIPSWSENTEVLVNGEKQEGMKAGQYFTIDREWSDGDEVVLSVPMEIKTSSWENNSVGVERGPLVYSLQIEEEWKEYEGNDAREIKLPHPEDFPLEEVVPASDWNYGLLVDRNNPESSFEVFEKDMPYQPFSNQDSPIVLKAKGKQIPDWGLDGNVAEQLPMSPVASSEPEEDITLIPYGAAKVRLSQIPQIGEPSLTTTREAETATVKEAQLKTDSTASNGKYVDMDQTGSVTFANVTVPLAESYTLTVHYANGGTQDAINDLYINGKKVNAIQYPKTGEWHQFSSENALKIDDVSLNANFYNAISLQQNNNNRIQIDRIEITPVGTITEPKVTSVEAEDDDGINLHTNVAANIGSYKVLYGKESGKLTTTAYGFNSEDANITGLDPETTYYFQVVANIGGQTVSSIEVSATTKAADEETPALDATFLDDFESGNADKWTEYGDTNQISVENQAYAFARSTNVKAVAGNPDWTDYVVEADIRPEDISRNNAGIMFRVTDSASGPDSYHGYFAGIGEAGGDGKGLLIGYGDGGWHNIKLIKFDVEANKYYHLKVVVYKKYIQVYVDGERKYAFYDDRFKQGQIGLRAYDTPFTADNVSVRNIEDADIADYEEQSLSVAPQVSAVRSHGIVTIKYEKVPATSYKIEYGTEKGNYTHEKYDVEFNSYKGGNPFNFDRTSIDGLDDNVTYYFRIVPLQNGLELTPSEEIVVLSKAGLESLLAEAKDISNNEATYTVESYQALQSAIATAEQALASIETEEELNTAVEALQEAIDGLVVNEPFVDASELENLIKQAKAYSNNDGKYTEDSFSSLQEAISDAEAALDNITTVEDVTIAVDALQKAIDGLIVDDKAIDTEEPVITLLGDNPITVRLHDTFVDPGATAEDQADGDLTNEIQVSGTVDTEKPGEYTLTYSVTDRSGNQATAIRKVKVVNDLTIYLGTEREVSSGELFTIAGTNSSILMPDDLPSGTKIMVNKYHTDDINKAGLTLAGDAYTITVTYPEGSKAPKQGFVLTLQYSDDAVEDAINIYYYDEDSNKWVLKGGQVATDRKTITLTVPHFSTYGVFQEGNQEEDQNPNNGEDQSDDEKNGNELPSTALGMFNWMLIGLVMFILGGIVLVRARQRHI